MNIKIIKRDQVLSMNSEIAIPKPRIVSEPSELSGSMIVALRRAWTAEVRQELQNKRDRDLAVFYGTPQIR